MRTTLLPEGPSILGHSVNARQVNAITMTNPVSKLDLVPTVPYTRPNQRLGVRSQKEALNRETITVIDHYVSGLKVVGVKCWLPKPISY